MENIIDIAKILRSYKIGTKLYSTAFGDVIFKGVDPYNENVDIEDANGYCIHTDKFGKYTKNGECILFPSKEMKDWEKFGWKKGDVLQYKKYKDYFIFLRWANEYYTRFVGLEIEDKQLHTSDTAVTYNHHKATPDEAKEFISKLEKTCGGKLNLETLEIEKQPKQYNLQPFDKVLVRDTDKSLWDIELFACFREYDKFPYHCIVNSYKQCLPYNEETAHLLGTTDEWKGGEG